MKKVLTGIGVLAVALGGVTACDPAARCGGVLTKSTTLTKDLAGCAGDALVVGADDIVIDLGGHTVSSDGGVGLRIAGHRNVRVRNGTIEGIEAGLAAIDSTRLTVDDVVARGEAVGLLLERVTDSTVRRSTANATDGIVLLASHGNRIETTRAPGGDAGNSVVLEGSHRNRIVGGHFTGGDGESMWLLDSDENELIDNDASNSNTVGIHLRRSDGNVLRGNRAGSESEAIVVIDSSDNLIEETEQSTWHDGGEPEGISIRGSDRTRLVRNRAGVVRVQDSTRTTVRDNRLDQVRVTRSDRTELDGNHLVASTAGWQDPDHGILVSADSTRSIVRGNVVTGFLIDGISIGAPGTEVRKNTADANGNHGIAAVPGVVDGGGNRASGNGNPVQCVNVVCT